MEENPGKNRDLLLKSMGENSFFPMIIIFRKPWKKPRKNRDLLLKSMGENSFFPMILLFRKPWKRTQEKPRSATEKHGRELILSDDYYFQETMEKKTRKNRDRLLKSMGENSFFPMIIIFRKPWKKNPGKTAICC